MNAEISFSPTTGELLPDLDQARRFLATLDPTADSFVFQTFDDSKQRKDPKLVRVLPGALEDHADTLAGLNRHGAGIFVTVNKSRNGGRKKADIDAGRAIFREADAPDLPPLPVEPSLVVESSPGKRHEYLLFDGQTADLSTWDAVMAGMVEVFGSDPNAKDRARVLRLPGFYHQKDPDHPHLVSIVHESGQRYSLSDLAKVIHRPEPEKRQAAPSQPKTTGLNAYAAAALKAECEGVMQATEGDRNATLNRAAFSLGQLVAGGELAEGAVIDELTAAAESAGLTPGEITATIRSGLESGKQHPRQAPEQDRQRYEEPPFPTDDDYSGLSGLSGQPGQNGQTGSQFGQNSGQNNRGWGDISGDVREYIGGHTGEVKFSQLCQDLGLFLRRDKKTANDALNYLVKTGVIEKHPVKRGVYIPTEPGLEIMKPTIEKGVPLPLTFPLGLHKHFNIMPGTVIVVGGATNSGKTIMAMDILRRWVGQLSGFEADPLRSVPHSLRSFSGGLPGPEEVDQRLVDIARTGIRYLNCEMTNEELGAILSDLGSDGDLLNQHVQWVNRKHDFPRAVLPDGITICDYLQIHRDFYEVGETIAQMADRVGSGILVIMIQKKSGESFPRGGEFALERARIALLLDSVTQNVKSCYLRKVKYPTDTRNHPERKEVEYRIGEGLVIMPVSELRWLDDKQRKRTYEGYSFQNISEDFR